MTPESSAPDAFQDYPTPEHAERASESDVALHGLPVVDRLFIDHDVPAEIVQELLRQLEPDERIFVLFQLNASHTFAVNGDAAEEIENAPLWTVVTGSRLLLLAASSQGQAYCDIFTQDSIIEYQNGLARDEIRIADTTITTGMWEGRRKLFKEAVALFPLPEYEKYLYLASVYLKNDQYLEALPFLKTSLSSEPTIKAYLLQAHAYSRTGTPDKAIDVLQHACDFADPAAIIAEIQHLFAENLVMFLYLAVVCEKNRWWDHGVSIYQYLLRKTPDFDLYALKLGELHNWKQEYAQAEAYYLDFIRQRTEALAADGTDFVHWDLSDSKCFGADPDLMKAYFDLAVMYECELHDPQQALSYYLALIRLAPFYLEAYQKFWQLYRQLLDEQVDLAAAAALDITMFLQVYRLLHPHDYAHHVTPEAEAEALSMSDAAGALDHLTAYRPLGDHDHARLMHPGEQEYWRKVQTWITSLVVSDDDEQGIEQYCEQVGVSNYPQLLRIIEHVAQFMGITPPRGFISRGKIGISVKNREQPFIFIGSEHLQADHACGFSESELVFMIAAQAEHIKSGHILITGTDLWKSLGTASFDGFLVALQLLPAGSFLGRLTHHFATEGLKRVYKRTRYSTIQKILQFVGRRGEPDDEDPDAAHSDAGADDSESALREQLVDFARHAVYTADRVGVLANGDIQAACGAMFKLAGDAHDDLAAFERKGLEALIQKRDKRQKYVYFEYAKRLRELIRFVLSLTYHELRKELLVTGEPPDAPPMPLSEYASIVKKLSLLEQSRQNDLLTSEEFFLKQDRVLARIAWLSEEDLTKLRAHQQACRDGGLTDQELHDAIMRHLERKKTDAATGAGAEGQDLP